MAVLLAGAFGYTAQPEAATPEGNTASRSASIAAGVTAFENGRFEEALQAWAEAEAALGDNAVDPARAHLLLRKTAAYLALGRFRNGVEAASEAFQIAEQTGPVDLLAEAASNLGNAYLMAGLESEARSTLDQAQIMAERAGHIALIASVQNNLATLAASSGQTDEAVVLFTQAIDNANAGADQRLATNARLNLARAHRDAGRSVQAARELDIVAAQLLNESDSHHKAYGLIGTGRLYADINLTPSPTGTSQPSPADNSAPRLDLRLQAHGALLAASRTAQAIGDLRAQAYAFGYLGGLYEVQGRVDEALELTRNAVLAALGTQAPEVLYQWQWQSARLLRRKGEIDAALLAYRRAVATLQSVRLDLTSGFVGSRLPFREKVGPLYLQMTDLLLREAASESDSQRLQEKLKEARQTIELLKGAELADYFQDDCVDKFRSRSTGIDTLAEHTVAVYPIILADRTELLISLPDGIRLIEVPISAERMLGEIRALRRVLVKRTTHEYIKHAQQLYDWLIRPLEDELARHQVDTLVLIPDGALRTVPLATLHDGERFLIEKYAIATSPGLTLTDPQPIERTEVRLLATALSDAVQGFPALPSVQREVDDIEASWGATVLRNRDFVLPNVESQLTEHAYSVVHIASHAQFDGDLDKTFLLTYDGRMSMDVLGDLIGVTAYRRQPVELLTLSACQTASGDDRAALGLAGVAVKAGARSALATLWFINDQASSELVSLFYSNLKQPDLSKAKALQRAQLKMLADRFYRHPIYWSPFLMIGNWL